MTDIKKAARHILAYIKKEIAEQKRKNPSFSAIAVELILFGEDLKNTNLVIKPLGYGNEPLAKNLTRSEAEQIRREVLDGLKSLRATRGWGRLTWQEEKTCPSSDLWCPSYLLFPTRIVLMAEACKEFKALASYLLKYCGRTVSETDLYYVGIGGKRGRVYGEESPRRYLCHRPNACASLLETLRKYRRTGDTVTCSAFIEEDEIDPWELEVSIRNEVEFGGIRYRLLTVTIISPSGNPKKKITLK